MKVFNDRGSKERLFEMFERVNKIKLTEAYTEPVPLSKNNIYALKDDLYNQFQIDYVADANNKGGTINKWEYVGKTGDGKEEFRNLGNPQATWTFYLPHLEVIGQKNGIQEEDEVNEFFDDDYRRNYASDVYMKTGEPLKVDFEPGVKDINRIHPAFNPKNDVTSPNPNKDAKLYGEDTEIDDLPPEEQGLDNEDILAGGFADNKSDDNYDPEQISKGINTEFEHTDDTEVAKEIAKDHLEEIPDYYDRLGDMEDDAKNDEEYSIIFGDNPNWYDTYKPVNVGENLDEAMGDDKLSFFVKVIPAGDRFMYYTKRTKDGSWGYPIKPEEYLRMKNKYNLEVVEAPENWSEPTWEDIMNRDSERDKYRKKASQLKKGDFVTGGEIMEEPKLVLLAGTKKFSYAKKMKVVIKYNNSGQIRTQYWNPDTIIGLDRNRMGESEFDDFDMGVGDTDAGQGAWEEEQSYNSGQMELEDVAHKMVQLRDSGDINALKQYINTLDVIPMYGSGHGGKEGLGHRELQELGLVKVVRWDEEKYVENISDKDIAWGAGGRGGHKYHGILKPGEKLEG